MTPENEQTDEYKIKMDQAGRKIFDCFNDLNVNFEMSIKIAATLYLEIIQVFISQVRSKSDDRVVEMAVRDMCNMWYEGLNRIIRKHGFSEDDYEFVFPKFTINKGEK